MPDLTPSQRAGFFAPGARCTCPARDCPRHGCEPCQGSGILMGHEGNMDDLGTGSGTGFCRLCYGARADAYGGPKR
jgi:hypothetical protein